MSARTKRTRFTVAVVAALVLVLALGAAAGAFAAKKKAGEISGAIRLLCWEGYEFPETYKSFVQKYKVTINPTFISSNDEIFAKLKAGDQYDIVTPIQAYIYPLVEHKLLQPIDTGRIANYKNVNPKIISALKPFNYNGKVWGVPICFGKNDFVFAADRVDCIESWWDVLKPEWQGRYIMLDDAIGQITQAARAIGVNKDPSLLTKEEFAKCKDLLSKMKKGARAIVTSFGEAKSMLISGETDGWFSANIMIAAQAKKEGFNIWGCIPKEGTLIFIDSYCIPANAPNPDAAYALCSELLGQATQITGVVDNLYCGAVTTDAIAKLNADQKALYPYDNMDKFFKQNILNGPIPLESDKYATFNDWVTMWEEVKAMD